MYSYWTHICCYATVCTTYVLCLWLSSLDQRELHLCMQVFLEVVLNWSLVPWRINWIGFEWKELIYVQNGFVWCASLINGGQALCVSTFKSFSAICEMMEWVCCALFRERSSKQLGEEHRSSSQTWRFFITPGQPLSKSQPHPPRQWSAQCKNLCATVGMVCVSETECKCRHYCDMHKYLVHLKLNIPLHAWFVGMEP